MKTFIIYPDKARALGNVMNNNSNVLDMVEVNSNVIPLLDEEHPITPEEGNQYCPPMTVDYDNLQFPIFQMNVLGSLYDTSLTLEVSANALYVGDEVTITATLRDNNGNLLDGAIAFKCGNDCITNGNNTGENVVYANTSNGVVSFTYAFDSMGEYTIEAHSLGTNRYHVAETTENINVSKKQITISIEGITNNESYEEDIPFTVRLLNSNNQIVSGLGYSITLDGEPFDTGTSSSQGESFTISNLDAGTHTIEVYYPGNNIYDSSTESIGFTFVKVPDVILDFNVTTAYPQYNMSVGDLSVGAYYDTVPISNATVTVTFRETPGSGIGYTVVTNSSGEAIKNGVVLKDNFTYYVTIVIYDEGMNLIGYIDTRFNPND